MQPAPPAPEKTASAEVLCLDQVHVRYDLPRSLGVWLRRKPPHQVRAVENVHLVTFQGRTVGLVGESGSGKTTLARAIVGLVERDEGRMELLHIPLPPKLSQRSLDTLRRLQMVFQNPEEALNPYHRVGASLRRPLLTLMKLSRRAADAEVARLLAAVRLPPGYAQRMPDQLSGGEKQRVAIARAFASNPELLLADEPVSSLDVSVQASILNLINELQRTHGNSLLFISHDLAVVGYVADEIAVIFLGQLMEVTPAPELFKPPYHPYTEALLSAIPLPDPDARQEPVRLLGEIPHLDQVPTGCPFHTRCPRILGEVCVRETPPWQVNPSNGQRYFCHIPPADLLRLQTHGEE